MNGNYLNEARTGTRGLEAEYRLKYSKWQADLRYSFYRLIEGDTVALYAVPGRPNLHRGLPANKVTASGRVDLGGGVSLNPSLLYIGTRYGTLDATSAGGPGLAAEGPTWLVNSFLLYERHGLSLRAGVHNLLDQSLRFLQPYDSGHAPYPGPTREWMVRAAYTYRFGAK